MFQAGSIHEVPDLVPSANAILHIIKTTALFNKMDELKVLCFEIIPSYPDNVLITLAVDHFIEIIEMLNLYCHQRIPLLIRLQVSILLIVYTKTSELNLGCFTYIP